MQTLCRHSSKAGILSRRFRTPTKASKLQMREIMLGIAPHITEKKRRRIKHKILLKVQMEQSVLGDKKDDKKKN